MRDDFVPLLFAGDINVYSVARAFHEEYGVTSYAYGKYNSWPCAGSKIINYTANLEADEQDMFLKLVMEFAENRRDKKVILIGCGDSYVQLISKNIPVFPENIIAPYVNIDMMNELINKEKFYGLCDRAGIDYPETFVHRKDMYGSFLLPFEGPFIAKPSNVVEYWKNPFPGQKKVFKTKDRSELDGILESIYDAGYDDSMIIQNFIPGDDSYMRVLTNYSDKAGSVRMMCLGHVLLEEHTPHGIGNHAVIITEHDRQLEDNIKSLLEGIKYIGYSNLDIKYDRRDGKYKVFELNARQGRSNYYVTNAGENIARYIVDDYIDNKKQECINVTEEALWLVIPKSVAFNYIPHEEYRARMRSLIGEGRYVNPLRYEHDGGFGRKVKFFRSQLSHFYKYKKYLGKKQGG